MFGEEFWAGAKAAGAAAGAAKAAYGFTKEVCSDVGFEEAAPYVAAAVVVVGAVGLAVVMGGGVKETTKKALDFTGDIGGSLMEFKGCVESFDSLSNY